MLAGDRDKDRAAGQGEGFTEPDDPRTLLFYGEAMLTSAEEYALFTTYQRTQDGALAQRLALANMRLVRSWAHHYWMTNRSKIMSSLDEDDLVSEGYLGLRRAVEKFAPEMGFKFSTVASIWIRQAIERALGDKGRTIRVPIYRGTQRRRETREGTPFSVVLPRTVSLDKPLDPSSDNPDETSLLFVLSETRADDPTATAGGGEDSAHDATLTRLSLQATLRDAMTRLDDRQRRVLELRYGLDAREGYEHTLEEIGRVMGFTRENARLIEAKALTILRACLIQLPDGEVYVSALADVRVALIKRAHAHARKPSQVAPLLSPRTLVGRKASA